MGSLLCRSFHLAHIQVLPSAGQTVQEQAEFRARHRHPPRPAISEPQIVDTASASAADRARYARWQHQPESSQLAGFSSPAMFEEKGW
jgi:hypothetical protein